MKKILFITLCISSFSLMAQMPEIKDIKQFISLGEKNGFKLSIPNQESSKLSKLYTDYLKSIGTTAVKPPKGSDELINEKLYLKGIDEPLLIFSKIQQEGPNVALLSYFFHNDSTDIPSQDIMKELLTNVYKKSMMSLYDDSIKSQSKIINKAADELKSLSKNREKADKNIASAKNKIADEEKNIEKSNGLISSLNGKITEYSSTKSSNESKLTEIKKSEYLVKNASNEIKDLNEKYKKMTSNLKNLQKDPALNANLIIAQTNDISSLEKTLTEKQISYKTLEENYKSDLKNAEKAAGNAADLLKDSDKKLKCENQNIQKSTNKISDLKNEITKNEKTIETFESTEKKAKQDEIDTLTKKLDALKNAQKIFQ